MENDFVTFVIAILQNNIQKNILVDHSYYTLQIAILVEFYHFVFISHVFSILFGCFGRIDSSDAHLKLLHLWRCNSREINSDGGIPLPSVMVFIMVFSFTRSSKFLSVDLHLLSHGLDWVTCSSYIVLIYYVINQGVVFEQGRGNSALFLSTREFCFRHVYWFLVHRTNFLLIQTLEFMNIVLYCSPYQEFIKKLLSWISSLHLTQTLMKLIYLPWILWFVIWFRISLRVILIIKDTQRIIPLKGCAPVLFRWLWSKLDTK